MSVPDGSSPEDSPNSRKAERVELQLDVSLRKTGYQKCSVELLNLSPTGCRIELPERVGVGEKVWITLPGLEPIQAKVVWVKDWIAGIEFDRPIHPVVFEHHLSRLRR